MSIRKEAGKFTSSEKNATVVYTRWYDEAAKPKALLAIAHGMAEYIDRYDEFARFMADHGYAVYGNDHLGHGRTAPRLEDRGYFAARDGRYCVMNDMRTLCGIARKDFPGIPLILMGHSMGSFIARLFCMNYPAEIEGAIFMGTAGKNPIGGIGVVMAGLLAAVKGERHKSAFFDNITFGSNNKAIENPKTAFDWLNTDEAEVQKYIADEDCGYTFTVNGYREIAKMVVEINEPGWAANIRPGLPVLVISGEGDPVGGLGKGVRETYDGLKQAGLKDLSLKLYPVMRHEILKEKDKALVFGDILAWCDGKLGIPG